MQFLFIIFGFHFLQQLSKATSCEIQNMQSKIACNVKFSDCYILEGDEEDYYKLKSINKTIIQKSFTIPYKNKPIQVKMFKLFEQGMIYKKLICQLFKNYKYYITCTSFDTLNYGQNHHLQESIQIETNILSDENCDEIYQLDDGRIIIFCLTQSHLRQYSVSLDGDAILMLEYEVVDQIQDQCKKTQHNIKGKNHFITAFFQCSQWKILLINNLQITIILETKMKDQYPSIKQFSKIHDIQFCSLSAQVLHFFEGQYYLQVNYGSIVNQSLELLKSENTILKIILLKICTNNILITYSKESNFQPFEKIGKEIVINQTFEVDNIHFFSDYIFFQNQTSLIIRIDHHLIQTYEILNTTLKFFELDKLFYQIDRSNDLIQFYRYFPISSFIEPKQKFIYIIVKLEVDRNQQLHSCFRMQYGNKSNEKIEYLQMIQIEKNCQFKQEVALHVKKYATYSQQVFSFKDNRNEVFNLSIWNEAIEDVKCYQRLKSYAFKSKTQLKSMHHLNYLVFQNGNQIYFHNCVQNKIEIIINTNQFEVFRHQEDYYLIDKKNQQLKVISFIFNLLSQIVLHNNIEIIKAYQVQQQLIIEVKNNKSPILISKTSFKYSNKYLSKNFGQPEQIIYYQELGSYTFVQYPNILAYEFQGDVKCFEFLDLVIISIKNWIKGLYQIFAVQNQTNSVHLYYLNLIELHSIQNYTLQEYQFSNPLKYSFAQSTLAILTEQHSTFFIALFYQTDQSITLIDIIKTDDTYFEIQDYTFLYLKNGQMRRYYLNRVDMLIHTNMGFYKHLFQQYNLTLKPTLKCNYELTLDVTFINECYQLFSLKNSISLRLQKNEKLYLRIPEMFSGPINNLTIQSNQKIYLKNPFDFITQINKCDLEEFNCIQEFKFKAENLGTLPEYTFLAMILNTTTAICHVLLPPIYDYIHQIFWMSDYTFIWFYSLGQKIQTQLLYCDREINGYCKKAKILVNDINIIIPLSSNIIKSQNLIKISNSLQQIYLYIYNQKVTVVNITDFNLDIKYVENSEDLFIALSKVDEVQQQKLRIYSINFNGYVEIFSDIITKQIKNLLPLNSILSNIQLISCRQTENVIVANIFVQYLNNFFTVKFQIDIQNGFQISSHLSKQIRNTSLEDNYIFEYLDDDYLILNSISANSTLLFDLQEERIFYDYCYLPNYYIQITRFNTTHFIFWNQSTVHLGMIQKYEIDLREIDDKNFNFNLYAQNQLSGAQISIHVEITSEGSNKSIILIQFVNMIFILMQLRLRQKRKRQKTYTTLRIQQYNQ